MVLLLLRLLAYLPLRFLHALGRGLGRLIYLLPGRYRKRLQANARQAGYDSPRFARQAAAQTGAMIMELPKVWLRTNSALDLCHNPEVATVKTALREQRGVLYLTPHLGCFEITARILVQHGPITVMYRPPRQSFLEPAMKAGRDLPGLRSVPANMRGVREFLRALRRGEAVGMLPDQVPSAGEGVWARFFNKPAYTMTLAARLAQQAQVPVILTAGERLPHGQGWRIHYLRIPEPYPTDLAAFVQTINDAMEDLIKQFPTQYLWSYNRYKIPADAPPIPDDLQS